MKRVLVISQEAIFGRGIESLLRKTPGIEVVGCEADLSIAISRLDELEGDVVILYGSFPSAELTPAMAWFLGHRSGARVIRLTPESNSLALYRTQRQDISDLDDLVRAITGEP